MRPRLKPLGEQVIVITGATSGIGLSVARAAAGRGAGLVLAARNEAALKTVCNDLSAKGAKVAYVVADVGVRADVGRIADTAIERFGGFDTWINNAGVGLYGALAEVTVEDHRRLFETDYWGVVYGSEAAVAHLKDRSGGGAVINLGSLLGDLPAPLQGPAAAAKHAVRAFTATLRMETARARVPVSVTLIRPGAVDTPMIENARSYLETPWSAPAPVYAAPLVAQTILYAAEHPVRQMTIGGMTAAAALFGRVFPGLAELAASRLSPRIAPAAPDGSKKLDNLHQPGRDLRERAWRAKVREQSIVVAAQMRPAAAAGLALAALGAALGCLILGRRLRGRSSRPAA
jgi:NADP-dependent 3-hydroxy acid dehydrogenase YdfG